MAKAGFQEQENIDLPTAQKHLKEEFKHYCHLCKTALSNVIIFGGPCTGSKEIYQSSKTLMHIAIQRKTMADV